MNDSIDFSIIIPAKNEELNIKNCIKSIICNDYDRRKYEILVIDNGSKDNTVNIATEMGAKVYIKPELTISGLRNFGAKQAKGKILAFLDADCTVDSKWLYFSSFYLKQNNVVSFGSPAIIPKISTWVQRSWFIIRGKKCLVEEVDWLESANVFVKNNSFHNCGGFDEDLITCEDYDLSVRLKLIGKIYSDSRIMATHHREPSTIINFFLKEKWRGKSNFYAFSKNGFQKKELPSILIPIIYLTFLSFFLYFLFLSIITSEWVNVTNGLITLILWQCPIFLLSCFKCLSKNNYLSILPLFILLNVYFLARGIALFSGVHSKKQ